MEQPPLMELLSCFSEKCILFFLLLFSNNCLGNMRRVCATV